MLKKIIFVWILLCAAALSAGAQTSAFTYQGKLTDTNAAASGQYDFTFKLFDAASGGTQIGTDAFLDNVPVSGGVFTVNLDFGAAAFAGGAPRFLETSVRPGASTGAFTLLTPRQAVTSAPFAIKSLNATSADTATNALQLGGTAADQFVQTNDTRLTDARTPLPNSPFYLANSTTQQPGDFNLIGNGQVSGALTATQFNIGSSRILGLFDTNLFAGSNAGVIPLAGQNNSIFGNNAGSFLGPGSNNSFFGSLAGRGVTTTGNNSFFGASAGTGNSGSANSFFGSNAGSAISSGGSNSFFGNNAGKGNTGNTNAFFGDGAGMSFFTGSSNSFFGANSASGIANGDNNAFFGVSAGSNISSTNNNSFFGAFANGSSFPSVTNATAIGYRAFVNQSNSLVLGSINGINGATADTSVGIGIIAPSFKLHVIDPSNMGLRVQTGSGGGLVASFGGAGAFQVDASGISGGRLDILENGRIGIGTTTPATLLDVNGIVTVRTLGAAGSTALCQNASLQIAACSSSLRYKTNIKSFVPGLELVRRLRPITFNWKADNKEDLGLGAEDVAKVEPLLVTKNAAGETEGVKYDRVAVVLVNAVKEQQTEIEAQQKQLDEQKALIKTQQAEIEALKSLVCSQTPVAKICKSKK